MSAKGYVFYDDETANHMQRICQLAYLCYDLNGKLIKEVNQLINPESVFEPAVYRHHYVREKDVVNAPNMQEFCDSNCFVDILTNYIFVAHNAKGADLHHIKKSLDAYGIEMPTIQYIDTMEMSSNNLGIGGLAGVCAHYGIDQGLHHDAFCDAQACNDIYNRMVAEFGAYEPSEWSPTEGTISSKKKKIRKSPEGLGYVHASEIPVRDVLEDFQKIGLRKDPNDIESLTGVHIVVSGIVPGYDRNSIVKTLQAIDAITASSVSGKTNLLVIGDNVGESKLEDAKKNNVPIISVYELLDIINHR